MFHPDRRVSFAKPWAAVRIKANALATSITSITSTITVMTPAASIPSGPLALNSNTGPRKCRLSRVTSLTYVVSDHRLAWGAGTTNSVEVSIVWLKRRGLTRSYPDNLEWPDREQANGKRH